jgi:protein-S-isoprenylcysteine O-methyltransferase Ste14
MDTDRNKHHQNKHHKSAQEKVLLRAILRVLLFLILSGVTFFGSHGSLNWGRAWLLLGIWVVYYALLYTWGRKVNPEVVLERASTGAHSPNPQWDRNILKSYLVISVMMNVTAGLDAGRFGWSEVPAWLVWGMLVFAVLANLVPLWVVLSNPFSSSVVRIQAERNHQVVTNGL